MCIVQCKQCNAHSAMCGEGGARSPPATPHRLQNPKWPPGGPKMAEGFWKGVYSWVFGHSKQLSLNKFFDHHALPTCSQVDNHLLTNCSLLTTCSQFYQYVLVKFAHYLLPSCSKLDYTLLTIYLQLAYNLLATCSQLAGNILTTCWQHAHNQSISRLLKRSFKTNQPLILIVITQPLLNLTQLKITLRNKG